MKRALACALAVFATTACASFKTTNTAELRPLLAPLAKHVADASPLTPATVTPLADEAMDDARIVGDTIVLTTLGYGDVSYARTPACAHVIGVERATGKVQWTHDRPKECGDAIIEATSSGVWYEDAKGKLALIAADDGSAKASIAIAKDAIVASSPGRVWVAAGGKATAYDAASGAAVSTVPLPASKPPMRLFVTPEAVFAGGTGGGLLALDPQTAATLATLPPKDVRGGFLPRWVHGVAVLPAPNGDVIGYGASGNEVFRTKLASARSLAVLGNDVAVVDAKSVHVFDPTNGAERFATALEGGATGALAFAPPLAGSARAAKSGAAARPSSRPPRGGAATPPAVVSTAGVVLATTSTSLVAIDAASGQTLYSAKLPSVFNPERVTDEIFVTSDGRTVVVANGFAFAAYRRATGEQVWSHRLRSFPMPTPLARAAAFASMAARAHLKDVGDMSKAVLRSQETQANAQHAMDNAFSRRVVVLGANVAGGGGAFASANFASGVVGGMYAAVDIANAKGDAAFLAGALRGRERLETALALQLADRVGDYLIRPIQWPSGEAFVVLRLDDGAYAEVPIGPSEWTFVYYTMTSVAAFSPTDKTFVAFGPGLDPARWHDDESQALMRLLGRSVLTFSLTDAAFHPAADYEEHSMVRKWDVP